MITVMVATPFDDDHGMVPKLLDAALVFFKREFSENSEANFGMAAWATYMVCLDEHYVLLENDADLEALGRVKLTSIGYLAARVDGHGGYLRSVKPVDYAISAVRIDGKWRMACIVNADEVWQSIQKAIRTQDLPDLYKLDCVSR